MKKFIIPVLALLALASCTAKFDEMNKPTTGITMDSAQPMYIFGRTLYNGSSNDHQRNIYWRDFYTDRLQEYWLINDICGDEDHYKCIKAANDVWNVVLWLRVIDRHGDAPYFDAEGNFGAGKGTTLPYSKVEDIYADLIKRLQGCVPSPRRCTAACRPGR